MIRVRYWAPEDKARVLKLFSEGLTPRAAAEATGIELAVIKGWCQTYRERQRRRKLERKAARLRRLHASLKAKNDHLRSVLARLAASPLT